MELFHSVNSPLLHMPPQIVYLMNL